jgi:hypothetical protein
MMLIANKYDPQKNLGDKEKSTLTQASIGVWDQYHLCVAYLRAEQSSFSFL